MSNYVPTDRPLRERFIFFLHSKRKAAEAQRNLQKLYRCAALSETKYRDWLSRFNEGDFDVDDCSREPTSKIEKILLAKSFFYDIWHFQCFIYIKLC